MGTRHLTVVQLDGEYKIAQYGQWDGYPSGQGKTVLDFLYNWDRSVFTEKVRSCRWITTEECQAIEDKIKIEHLDSIWDHLWPQLSRDTGAKILELVQVCNPGMKLRNSIDFAADSLFCEWAYVIDLDKNVLEVYKGFQTKPPPPIDRFANMKLEEETEDLRKEQNKYYPIRQIAFYHLDSLPSLQQFCEECDPPEIY